ncbi:MAG: hypothetical protein HY921_11055 [Elusimicrobia bacterium]|nr:hypothetical protein [Elusimicrobiota bacterium]
MLREIFFMVALFPISARLGHAGSLEQIKAQDFGQGVAVSLALKRKPVDVPAAWVERSVWGGFKTEKVPVYLGKPIGRYRYLPSALHYFDSPKPGTFVIVRNGNNDFSLYQSFSDLSWVEGHSPNGGWLELDSKRFPASYDLAEIVTIVIRKPSARYILRSPFRLKPVAENELEAAAKSDVKRALVMLGDSQREDDYYFGIVAKALARQNRLEEALGLGAEARRKENVIDEIVLGLLESGSIDEASSLMSRYYAPDSMRWLTVARAYMGRGDLDKAVQVLADYEARLPRESLLRHSDVDAIRYDIIEKLLAADKFDQAYLLARAMDGRGDGTISGGSESYTAHPPHKSLAYANLIKYLIAHGRAKKANDIWEEAQKPRR